MLDGVGNGRRPTDVDPSQREPVELQRADDGGQIADPCIKAEIRNIPIRRSHPAVIETDHAPPEMNQPVCHLLDVRKVTTVARGVAKDVRRKDEGQPVADSEVGDSHPVAGGSVVQW